MSYLDILKNESLFHKLHAIDRELAEKARATGCAKCGGPLHRGYYVRKPRGELLEIPEHYRIRLSLCCGHCRHRVLPKSVLFMGRRVYWGAVVLLVSAATQSVSGFNMRSLAERFDVSRRTVKRWLQFFAAEFPQHSSWLRARGLVGPQVRGSELPISLVRWLATDSDFGVSGVIKILKLFADVS